jgi:hypothetical protein
LEKIDIVTSSRAGLYIDLMDLAKINLPLSGRDADRTDKGSRRTGGEEVLGIGAARSASGRGQIDIEMSPAAFGRAGPVRVEKLFDLCHGVSSFAVTPTVVSSADLIKGRSKYLQFFQIGRKRKSTLLSA